MFETFWKLYPARHGRKLGKALCLKLFVALSPEDQALVLHAAQHYAQASQPKGEEFVPLPRDPIRFLKADWWRDWVEGPPAKAVAPLTPTAPIGSGISMHEAFEDWPEGLAKLQRFLSHKEVSS